MKFYNIILMFVVAFYAINVYAIVGIKDKRSKDQVYKDAVESMRLAKQAEAEYDEAVKFLESAKIRYASEEARQASQCARMEQSNKLARRASGLALGIISDELSSQRARDIAKQARFTADEVIRMTSDNWCGTVGTD